MTTRSTFVLSLVAVLSFASGIALYAVTGSQPLPQSHTARLTEQHPEPQSNMHDMMKMHERTMAEMKAADARLGALVADMNAATGEARVSAIAAVVNELVGQQQVMHAHMGQMHQVGCCGTMHR